MDDELIVQAGEYVLGTLDGAEQRAFLLRMARDHEAVAAVGFWRERLAPLLGGAEAVDPPAAVWPAIEAQLAARQAPANDNGVSRWWRGGTVAASLAAAFLAVVALRPDAPRPAPVEVATAPAPVPVPAPVLPEYVAAVSAEGAEPALLITLDPRTGRARVRALGLTPPAKKSLEVWYIGGGRAPQSLGLIAGNAALERVLSQAVTARDKLDDSLFAVSVEPEGGSPGDTPTGTIVYTGKAVRVGGTS